MVINMFNGYRVIDNRVFLFLDNNYEFASDINTKRKKEKTIIEECEKYLFRHNLTFNDKLYFVSNKNIIGFIEKNKKSQ